MQKMRNQRVLHYTEVINTNKTDSPHFVRIILLFTTDKLG